MIPQRIRDKEIAKQIRESVAKYLGDNLPGVSLPDDLQLRIQRQPGHIHVTWQGKVEAKTFGRPDMIDAKFYADHAIVKLTISGVRIDYSA